MYSLELTSLVIRIMYKYFYNVIQHYKSWHLEYITFLVMGAVQAMNLPSRSLSFLLYIYLHSPCSFGSSTMTESLCMWLKTTLYTIKNFISASLSSNVKLREELNQEEICNEPIFKRWHCVGYHRGEKMKIFQGLHFSWIHKVWLGRSRINVMQVRREQRLWQAVKTRK